MGQKTFGGISMEVVQEGVGFNLLPNISVHNQQIHYTYHNQFFYTKRINSLIRTTKDKNKCENIKM